MLYALIAYGIGGILYWRIKVREAWDDYLYSKERNTQVRRGHDVYHLGKSQGQLSDRFLCRLVFGPVYIGLLWPFHLTDDLAARRNGDIISVIFGKSKERKKREADQA